MLLDLEEMIMSDWVALLELEETLMSDWVAVQPYVFKGS